MRTLTVWSRVIILDAMVDRVFGNQSVVVKDIAAACLQYYHSSRTSITLPGSSQVYQIRNPCIALQNTQRPLQIKSRLASKVYHSFPDLHSFPWLARLQKCRLRARALEPAFGTCMNTSSLLTSLHPSSPTYQWLTTT